MSPMENEKERFLRVCEMSFVGKVLREFTHELKNHLAIIRETAGLVEDLMTLRKSPSKDDREEYLKPLHSISTQIDKTIQLVNHLNTFSHRMDVPHSAFSVNQAIEELAALIHRFSSQKGIKIETDFETTLPQVYGDPSRFSCLLFCLIEEAMEALLKDSRLTIKTESSREAVIVSLISQGNIGRLDRETRLCKEDAVKDFTEALGASLVRNKDERTTRLILPLSPAPSGRYDP